MIMNCGHQATGPGIYCIRAHVGRYPDYEIDDVSGPYRVGTATFDAGTSPALVNVVRQGVNYLYLFARGQNGQIWYAYYPCRPIHGSAGIRFRHRRGTPFHRRLAPGHGRRPATCSLPARARSRARRSVVQEGVRERWSGHLGGLDHRSAQASTAYKWAVARGTNSVFLFGVQSRARIFRSGSRRSPWTVTASRRPRRCQEDPTLHRRTGGGREHFRRGSPGHDGGAAFRFSVLLRCRILRLQRGPGLESVDENRRSLMVEHRVWSRAPQDRAPGYPLSSAW